MPPSKLTDSQLQILAVQDVAGKGLETMALSTGLTKSRVEGIVNDGRLKGVQLKAFEGFRANARIVRHAADEKFKMEMQEIAPTAIETIGKAAGSFEANPDLATRTSWDVLRNAGMPVVSERGAGGGDMNAVNQINNFFQTPKAQESLTTAFDAIKVATEGMDPLGPVGGPSKHIRVSEAELVTAPKLTTPPEAEEVSG